MRETTISVVPQSAAIVPVKVVYATELFPPAALVDRGSSLRSALHGRLAIGETLHIPTQDKERVRGVMVNVGAKGGTVMLRSREAEIIKSMTIYFDAKHPDWFSSLLVDFSYPLAGGCGGVTMQLMGSEVVPSEPTIHAKPLIPGRYGKIEIEGVLLSECENARLDYSCPVYDWMPFDLAELPEARQLLDRLCKL
jgi:hypothetical protein